eukprot:5658107-Amphidinium_carterae.1
MRCAVQSLSRDPSSPLPATFVGRVLSSAAERLKAQRHSAVARVNVDETKQRLVVLGDMHGQLEDMLWIFLKHGLPNPSVFYLFNGDIVDRGCFALEVFTLALGFLVAWPASVFINRGSHEDENLNHGPVGGLYDECRLKYGTRIGGLLYEQVLEIYSLLPLASVINGS